MVTRCSCLPVWSNNNSLISFYHSLSNRPKSFPNSLKTLSLSLSLLSLLSLSTVPFITLNLFPKHLSVSFSVTSASCLQSVCVCVLGETQTHTRTHTNTEKSFIRLHKWPISVSLCFLKLAFHFQLLFIYPEGNTSLLTSVKKTTNLTI